MPDYNGKIALRFANGGGVRDVHLREDAKRAPVILERQSWTPWRGWRRQRYKIPALSLCWRIGDDSYDKPLDYVVSAKWRLSLWALHKYQTLRIDTMLSEPLREAYALAQIKQG